MLITRFRKIKRYSETFSLFLFFTWTSYRGAFAPKKLNTNRNVGVQEINLNCISEQSKASPVNSLLCNFENDDCCDEHDKCHSEESQ